jgi:hypothetical protein
MRCVEWPLLWQDMVSSRIGWLWGEPEEERVTGGAILVCGDKAKWKKMGGCDAWMWNGDLYTRWFRLGVSERSVYFVLVGWKTHALFENFYFHVLFILFWRKWKIGLEEVNIVYFFWEDGHWEVMHSVGKVAGLCDVSRGVELSKG